MRFTPLGAYARLSALAGQGSRSAGGFKLSEFASREYRGWLLFAGTSMLRPGWRFLGLPAVLFLGIEYFEINRCQQELWKAPFYH